ncbi:MAG TPA: nuclear transport factor 2 family protein [Ktedonobacterales bacterium]|jgi:ketosteroid isomerase-like protein
MHDEPTIVVRDVHAEETITAVNRFNDALNRHDLDSVMALMTDDCVLDTTWPPPDGQCITGQAAVRAYWEQMLQSSPDAHFATEELFATGDRCTVRWRYTFNGTQHIRGVDVLRVRDGKIAEKLAYVKG